MKNKQTKQGIGRRTFLKTMGIAALGIGGSMFPAGRHLVRPAAAQEPGTFESCRIVVFGLDGLRVDYAQRMWDDVSPGLRSLSRPICATCGGLSQTQPGWASIWSGLPSQINNCWDNSVYKRMRPGHHVMEKLITAYQGRDLFAVWIVGKGNIVGASQKPGGRLKKGSHYGVYRMIVEEEKEGIYFGDDSRDSQTVYSLALDALAEARTHDNFIAFVQFNDPDKVGHAAVRSKLPDDFDAYMQSALEVDGYMADLMTLLPGGTKVICCSDHGFDFKSQGDARNHHEYSPYGMLATNFQIVDTPFTSQISVGRLIYKLAGGDPDRTRSQDTGAFYRMFGEDLV